MCLNREHELIYKKDDTFACLVCGYEFYKDGSADESKIYMPIEKKADPKTTRKT
jgi:hypothetical protein